VHSSGRMRSAPTEWGTFRRKYVFHDGLGPSSHPIHPGSTIPSTPLNSIHLFLSKFLIFAFQWVHN